MSHTSLDESPPPSDGDASDQLRINLKRKYKRELARRADALGLTHGDYFMVLMDEHPMPLPLGHPITIMLSEEEYSDLEHIASQQRMPRPTYARLAVSAKVKADLKKRRGENAD